MRKTKQREVILEELMKLRAHPSADELYERVKKRLPRISLGTVYRNLEMLSREGIIHRLETAGSQKRFDGETGDHQHIRCVRCGRIDDLPAGGDSREMRRARREGNGVPRARAAGRVSRDLPRVREKERGGM